MANIYVFCPWCGGITYPGICSNCGRDTVTPEERERMTQQQKNLQQNIATTPISGTTSTPNKVSNGQPVFHQTNNSGKKKEKKKEGTVALWLLGILAFLLVCFSGVLFIGSIAFTVFYQKPEETKDAKSTYKDAATIGISFWNTDPYLYGYENGYEYSICGNEVGRDIENTLFAFENYDGISIYSDVDMDFFSSIEAGNYLGEGHSNEQAVSDAFGYYCLYCDNFDDTYGYEVEMDCIDFGETTPSGYSNTAFDVYYQIKGENIPNLDNLNASIKELSTKKLENYLSKSYRDDIFYECTDCYVSYNDEEFISFVFLGYSQDMDNSRNEIFSLTVDLVNGCIVNSQDMITVTDDFTKQYISQSALQNQNDSDLSYIGYEGIKDCLLNPKISYAFYTPLGIEVATNVEYSGNYFTGWFTATFIDYEDIVSDKRFFRHTSIDTSASDTDSSENESAVDDVPGEAASDDVPGEPVSDDTTNASGTNDDIPIGEESPL